MDRFAARKSINRSSLACHGAQPPSLKLFAQRDPFALRHSDRGRLPVAVHGCWMSSETAHMHVRTKICRLASVEATPMRDVWQPGAALRAISRRLCSPAEVVRTPVQWQHGLSGRDRSLTRHKRCTWHAWVMCWRSQAVPVTLSTLCTMVTDMLRFRPRQSHTSTTQAAGDEATPVARPRRVVSALPWSRAQKLACTSVSASPDGSSVKVNVL